MFIPLPRVHEVVLVEFDQHKRDVLAERLRIQGFSVEAFGCATRAAIHTLASPPSAVVADLWMPGVSGLQLCRLLRSEAATEGVPIILRGKEDTPKERFWADRAGASAYVAKGRMGELARSLRKAIDAAPPHDGFFQMYPESLDIRDRIGRLLDQALFESLLASEIRALSTCESLTRMFDLFSQFLCQVTTYRWLAIATEDLAALHTHASNGESAELEARAALDLPAGRRIERLEDDDASALPSGPAPLVRKLHFGAIRVGQLAIACCEGAVDLDLIELVAREIAGPMRIVSLVQETRRLASHDPLTGIYNRRAFSEAVERELARATRFDAPLSMLLFDIDHFKRVNDHYGHGGGDQVLAAVGEFCQRAVRPYDVTARWGGEEFVIALPQTDSDRAALVAERIRIGVQDLEIFHDDGARIAVSVSVGVTTQRDGEGLAPLINRADVAMYTAKTSGRNRVCVDAEPIAALVAEEERAAG